MQEQVYPEYYLLLFRAATDAIAALDAGQPGLARRLLVQGQQLAEDAAIGDTEAE